MESHDQTPEIERKSGDSSVKGRGVWPPTSPPMPRLLSTCRRAVVGLRARPQRRCKQVLVALALALQAGVGTAQRRRELIIWHAICLRQMGRGLAVLSNREAEKAVWGELRTARRLQREAIADESAADEDE